MRNKRFVGDIIFVVVALVIASVLVTNVAQPIVNTSAQASAANWGGYTGAGQVVTQVPVFNALIILMVGVGGMFTILARTGLVK